MKHAHGVRRRKKRRPKSFADSGAAVGEMEWAVIVSCYFSLRAEGPKKSNQKKGPLPGRCPKPRHLLKKVDENFSTFYAMLKQQLSVENPTLFHIKTV